MEKPKDRSFPTPAPELVARLEEAFPDRCPTDDMTDRQVWMAAGAAKVVRKLRIELNRTETTVIQKA